MCPHNDQCVLFETHIHFTSPRPSNCQCPAFSNSLENTADLKIMQVNNYIFVHKYYEFFLGKLFYKI